MYDVWCAGSVFPGASSSADALYPQEFDPDLQIGGLLLNRVGGAAHTKWLQDAITSSGVAATFLGAIPKVSVASSRIPLPRQHGVCSRAFFGQCECGFEKVYYEHLYNAFIRKADKLSSRIECGQLQCTLVVVSSVGQLFEPPRLRTVAES